MAWLILALIAGAYFGAFALACLVAWRDTHPRHPQRRRIPTEPIDWGPVTETQ